MIRRKKDMYLVLEALFELHYLWKKDVLLLIRSCHTDTYNKANKTYQALFNDNLISEREIPVYIRRRRGSDDHETIVSLTRKGLAYLADQEEYYFLHKNKADFSETNDPKKLVHLLMKSRACMEFQIAGAHAFHKNRPDLYAIYRNQEYLPVTGCFYSSAEVRAFANQIEPGIADTFFGSRFTGIYINKKKCAVIYMPMPGDNTLIKIQPRFEIALSELLKKTLSSSVDAVILTDTAVMVQKMLFHNQSNHDFMSHFIGFSTDFYEHICVIPYSMNGLESLKYYLTHSVEDWQRDSYDITCDPELFIRTKDPVYPADLTFQRTSGSVPKVIYLPVYELKILHEISHQNNQQFAVITKRHMTDGLACALCRNVIYLDEELNLIPEELVLVYDTDGEPAGENRLIKALKEQSYDRKEVMKQENIERMILNVFFQKDEMKYKEQKVKLLQAYRNQTYESYNDLNIVLKKKAYVLLKNQVMNLISGYGADRLERIVQELTEGYEKKNTVKKNKRVKHVYVSVVFHSQEEVDLIKSAAKKKQWSVNRYISYCALREARGNSVN